MIIVNEVNLHSKFHYKQQKISQFISHTSLAALITVTSGEGSFMKNTPQ